MSWLSGILGGGMPSIPSFPSIPGLPGPGSIPGLPGFPGQQQQQQQQMGPMGYGPMGPGQVQGGAYDSQGTMALLSMFNQQQGPIGGGSSSISGGGLI